ncbi:MAG: acyl-CoA dehydrogenase family protein, partial [Vicinamibacterales bacterium]
MTYELDDASRDARERARAAAADARQAAAAIDSAAAIPEALRQAARAALPPPSARRAWVVGLEELAAASGSVAVDAGWPGGPPAGSAEWPGLRGAALTAAHEASARPDGWLGIAAVLIGLGRAALAAAVEPLRDTRAATGTKPEFEHWGLADTATELDAARLLLWQAAESGDPTGAAMARLQARLAAEAAVAAARRVLGPAGLTRDGLLDRVGRDVATAGMIFGGPDADETAVAAGVLPG